MIPHDIDKDTLDAVVAFITAYGYYGDKDLADHLMLTLERTTAVVNYMVSQGIADAAEIDRARLHGVTTRPIKSIHLVNQ